MTGNVKCSEWVGTLNIYKLYPHFSMQIVGVRIFFKYNAGDSFKMDVPYGNKELLGRRNELLDNKNLL